MDALLEAGVTKLFRLTCLIIRLLKFCERKRIVIVVTVHELRALASSWAHNCHIVLEDILSAVFSHSFGIFLKNYLRDLAATAEVVTTLGLVVAAQHVCGR